MLGSERAMLWQGRLRNMHHYFVAMVIIFGLLAMVTESDHHDWWD